MFYLSSDERSAGVLYAPSEGSERENRFLFPSYNLFNRWVHFKAIYSIISWKTIDN